MLSRPNGELRDGRTARQSRYTHESGDRAAAPLLEVSRSVPSSHGAVDAVRFSAARQFSPGARIAQAAEQGRKYLRKRGRRDCRRFPIPGDQGCLVASGLLSRPVSEYAIYLNDFMMHRVRNELLVPFITRLPGTSDAPWVEEERARLIVVETVRRIVAAEYDEVWGKPKLAARCRAVQLFEQVSPAMAKAQAVLPLECGKQALKGLG